MVFMITLVSAIPWLSISHKKKETQNLILASNSLTEGT